MRTKKGTPYSLRSTTQREKEKEREKRFCEREERRMTACRMQKHAGAFVGTAAGPRQQRLVQRQTRQTQTSISLRREGGSQWWFQSQYCDLHFVGGRWGFPTREVSFISLIQGARLAQVLCKPARTKKHIVQASRRQTLGQAKTNTIAYQVIQSLTSE